MECQDYQRLVSKMHDGELSSDETAEVFLHLSTCGACREFYSSLRVLDGALNRIADHLPSGRAARPLAIPTPAESDRWWNRQVAMRVPVFALLLCAIALSLFALLPGGPLSRDPEAIYVTKLPTIVVDAQTAPLDPQ
jgi:predicted anti-sigma-YlaC factor YlaD